MYNCMTGTVLNMVRYKHADMNINVMRQPSQNTGHSHEVPVPNEDTFCSWITGALVIYQGIITHKNLK